MELYSISEFKNFCDSNDILEYRVETNSYSECLGITAKVDLCFKSIVVAEGFNIIMFEDGNNKASIMPVERIEKITVDSDDVQLFYIYCGCDEETLFKVYIKLNTNSNKCFCNKCNKEFNIFDIHNGLKIKRVMGYGSTYDGDDINLNICTNCLDELINSCLINPIVN